MEFNVQKAVIDWIEQMEMFKGFNADWGHYCSRWCNQDGLFQTWHLDDQASEHCTLHAPCIYSLLLRWAIHWGGHGSNVVMSTWVVSNEWYWIWKLQSLATTGKAAQTNGFMPERYYLSQITCLVHPVQTCLPSFFFTNDVRNAFKNHRVSILSLKILHPPVLFFFTIWSFLRQGT